MEVQQGENDTLSTNSQIRLQAVGVSPVDAKEGRKEKSAHPINARTKTGTSDAHGPKAERIRTGKQQPVLEPATALK